MARRAQTKAAPAGAAPAAPNAQAAAATQVAAETSTGGSAAASHAADATGSGSSQATEAADSVCTSAATEAASSLQAGAASPHNQASDWVDLDDIALLGSNTLPAQLDIGRAEPLALGELVVMTQGCSGLSPADWNALAEDVREAALALMLAAMRAVGQAQTKIEILLAPIDESLVLVTAKTRYGGDMTRAGLQWTRNFRSQAVTPEVAGRLREDPNLIVEGD